MPSDKKRLAIVIEDWMDEAIEEYRHANRLPSTSRAVVQLIEIGLKAEKAPTNKPEPRKLDEAKIRKHIEAIRELLDEESG